MKIVLNSDWPIYFLLPVRDPFLLGQLFNTVDLIKPSLKCPSVHKIVLNFSEIWHLGRGRWVMHDGMCYNTIQGQEPSKLEILPFLKAVSSAFTMGAGNWPWILKLWHNIYIWSGRMFDILPSFCHVTEVGTNVSCKDPTVSPRTGLISRIRKRWQLKTRLTQRDETNGTLYI